MMRTRSRRWCTPEVTATEPDVYGRVTSTVNMFTGSHVSGDLTLDRGLKQASDGGDCSANQPLTALGVTAVKLRFS
jgi:hypothetical protein